MKIEEPGQAPKAKEADREAREQRLLQVVVYLMRRRLEVNMEQDPRREVERLAPFMGAAAELLELIALTIGESKGRTTAGLRARQRKLLAALVDSHHWDEQPARRGGTIPPRGKRW
jgi:hypothetical protein